jgi:hypothetical protein
MRLEEHRALTLPLLKPRAVRTDISAGSPCDLPRFLNLCPLITGSSYGVVALVIAHAPLREMLMWPER